MTTPITRNHAHVARLPYVTTSRASWPDRAWPAGLANRPPIGGHRGYHDRDWTQAMVLSNQIRREARNGMPELARLLCLADAAMTGRYAVIRCRPRLWPLIRRMLSKPKG